MSGMGEPIFLGPGTDDYVHLLTVSITSPEVRQPIYVKHATVGTLIAALRQNPDLWAKVRKEMEGGTHGLQEVASVIEKAFSERVLPPEVYPFPDLVRSDQHDTSNLRACGTTRSCRISCRGATSRRTRRSKRGACATLCGCAAGELSRCGTR